MLDQAHPETEKILTDRRLVKYKPFAKLVEAAAREQRSAPAAFSAKSSA